MLSLANEPQLFLQVVSLIHQKHSNESFGRDEIVEKQNLAIESVDSRALLDIGYEISLGFPDFINNTKF